jgi:2'-5' RNA ligase
MRLFCAVELSGDARRLAAAHAERLRASFPDVRAGWERAEKLHVTLKFFGEVDEARLDSMHAAGLRVASSLTPFNISIAGCGAFPKGRAPRVLWLGVGEGAGALIELQKTLEDEFAHEGFVREKASLSSTRHPRPRARRHGRGRCPRAPTRTRRIRVAALQC